MDDEENGQTRVELKYLNGEGEWVSFTRELSMLSVVRVVELMETLASE